LTIARGGIVKRGVDDGKTKSGSISRIVGSANRT
jgi:hypothetical protein